MTRDICDSRAIDRDAVGLPDRRLPTRWDVLADDGNIGSVGREIGGGQVGQCDDQPVEQLTGGGDGGRGQRS